MADCIDTQVLIWGIKRQASPNRQEMLQKATHFFQERQRFQEKLIVPAPALAELLVRYDADQRNQSLALIGKGFIVWPFDAKAASFAAELQADWNQLHAIGQEHGLSRQCIKSDIQIIATALSAGALCIYSEDAHMEKFAQGRIAVKCLPEVPKRARGLFDSDDA